MAAALKSEKLERAHRVLKGLETLYPDAHCALDHETPFQLLVATVLSAQCTDARVNLTTPALFSKFPDARAMAQATVAELEALVRPTGFYRNKARSLLELSQELVRLHGGEVPKSMEALTALRGVGRKTANVVLGNAFGLAEGIVVDTHVGRLARRLGWTRAQDPLKVEADLMAWVPRERWVRLSHELIMHGRAVCGARKAKCGECGVEGDCEKRMG